MSSPRLILRPPVPFILVFLVFNSAVVQVFIVKKLCYFVSSDHSGHEVAFLSGFTKFDVFFCHDCNFSLKFDRFHTKT